MLRLLGALLLQSHHTGGKQRPRSPSLIKITHMFQLERTLRIIRSKCCLHYLPPIYQGRGAQQLPPTPVTLLFIRTEQITQSNSCPNNESKGQVCPSLAHCKQQLARSSSGACSHAFSNTYLLPAEQDLMQRARTGCH